MHIYLCVISPFSLFHLPPVHLSEQISRIAAPQSPHVCRHCLFILSPHVSACVDVAIVFQGVFFDCIHSAALKGRWDVLNHIPLSHEIFDLDVLGGFYSIGKFPRSELLTTGGEAENEQQTRKQMAIFH